jgi:hypothetical protein
MPIKQERMLILLEAADAFSTTLRAASTFISDTASTITPETPRETLLQAIHNIQQYFSLASIPHRYIEAIAEEKAHFKLNKTRNERHARRSKLKRLGLKPTQLPNPNPPRSSETITLSDVELAKHGHDAQLTNHKLQINAQYREARMTEPYPDVYDTSIPLTLEHQIGLGLIAPPESDDSLF